MSDFDNNQENSDLNVHKMGKKGCIIYVTVFVVVLIVVFGCLFGLRSCVSSTENPSGYIGEAVSDGSVTFKVTSVENTQSFSLYSTTHNYVVIYFDVTNKTNGTISINPLYCKLMKGSVEYDCVTYDYDIFDIVPGGTESLYLVYETTQTTDEATFVMSFGYGLAHAYVIDITLKERTA